MKFLVVLERLLPLNPSLVEDGFCTLVDIMLTEPHGKDHMQRAGHTVLSWRKRTGLWVGSTCLFNQVHKSGSQAPGLVSMALQGADSQLGGPVRGDGHHVHGIIHQGRFRLWRNTHHIFISTFTYRPLLVWPPPASLPAIGPISTAILSSSWRVFIL